MLAGLRKVGQSDRPGDEARRDRGRRPTEPSRRRIEGRREPEEEIREEDEDDDGHALRDDLEIRCGGLGENLARKSDRAERAEAERRPEARCVAPPPPVPKRDKAEQPERHRNDVAQDVVDGFRAHASTGSNKTVVSGGLSRERANRVELPKRPPRRTRPRFDARRRDSPRRRDGGDEAWLPRAYGERFQAFRDSGSRGTTEGRVLVVDDESSIRLVCRLNLRSAGFDTVEASDGASAIALARAERPDLILLDVMLPDLDGWRVAAELAENDETREIPICSCPPAPRAVTSSGATRRAAWATSRSRSTRWR